MAKEPFSAEGVRFWMIELASTEQSGWASFEGFLLRELLAHNLTLEQCKVARELFKQLTPYMMYLPKWRLLQNYISGFYKVPTPPPIAPRILPEPMAKKKVLPVEVTPADDDDDLDMPFIFWKSS